MNKSKEQILIEKLRKVSHKARLGQMMRPGMPPMAGFAGHPGFAGKMCPPAGCPGMTPPPRGHHGPVGMMHPPMGHPGPGPACPPKLNGFFHGRPGPMPREILLLAVLDQGENGIRQKDLAAKIGINASSLSEQIDHLEADRYLERRENPDDKRSTLIFLTEKGKARAYEVQDQRQQAAEKFLDKLSDEEKDTLISLLDKLLAE